MLSRQLLHGSRRALPPLRPSNSSTFLRQRPHLAPRPYLRLSSTDAPSRANRILSRLPRPLQRYTTGLRNAPVSHIIAFLILHEITAVVPLLGLWAFFHYTEYIPLSYVTQRWGLQVRDGVARAERYFKRKGWFGFGDEEDGESHTSLGGELASTGAETEQVQHLWAKTEGRVTGKVDVSYTQSTASAAKETEDVLRHWAKDGKYRVVVEVALAWAITKALLPVRIVVSVWATPWFAGVMSKTRRMFRP